MGVNLRRERMVFASSELKFLYSQHLALFQRACALSQGFDDAVSELTRGLTLHVWKTFNYPCCGGKPCACRSCLSGIHNRCPYLCLMV